jgi:hypothetical protein
MRRLSRFVPNSMRAFRFICGCLLLVLVAGCDGGSDGPAAPGPDDETEKRIVDVFVDLEAAFNHRDIAAYSRLLDEDFVFKLAASDVVLGKPIEWDRAADIEYTTKLFDPDNDDPMRCDSVYFDFNYPRFIPFRRYNPATRPDETWWATRLSFDFTFDFAPGLAVTSAPVNEGVFVIRNAGTEARPVWKLIEMYDIGADDADFVIGDVDTLVWTLGATKALYLPPAKEIGQ